MKYSHAESRFVRRILLLLLVITSGSAHAQTRFHGKVTDTQGNSLENVIVKLKGGTRTYKYVFTNKSGDYAIELGDTIRLDRVSLIFSHISHENREYVFNTGGGNRRVDATLIPKTQALAEVKIKASPLSMRGDTLRYSLAPFLGKGDVTLEDGLKRLPGINVSSSGSISYMGRDISHFYIEGLDMLSGKYSLATRNIPAEYASQVEILRNHNDKKIDSDEESDAVALNIRLKNKAKFRPFGRSQVGAGYRDGDFLHAIGLTGMMFMNNFQTICAAKYSNYGDFASSDMADHFGGSGVGSHVMALLGPFGGGRPPRGEYLNRTNGMVSLNGIKKVDSTLTIKMNANYAYEDRDYTYSTVASYFANGGNVVLSESMSPQSLLHKPALEINSRKDSKSIFVSNTLKIKAQIEQNENPVTKHTGTDDEQISQKREASGFEITNQLHTRALVGNNKLGISSFVSLVRTPELKMTFNLPGHETDDNTTRGITQSGQGTSLRTTESAAFTLKLTEKLSIWLPVDINAAYDFIETIRRPDLSENNIKGWQVSPAASPSLEWKSADKRLWLKVGSKIRWLSMSYKAATDGKRTNLHDIYLEPDLGIKYTFSATSELSLSSSVNNGTGDILDLLTADMQTDYKSTSAASGVIARTSTWNTTLAYKYEMPFAFFNLNTSASWSQGKRNILSSQFIDGEEISSSEVFGDSHSRNAKLRLGMSKNIIGLHAKLNLDGVYGWSSNEMMEQGKPVTTYANGYTIHTGISIAPLKWMELNYALDYNKLFTRYAGRHDSSESLSHVGRLSVFPFERMELSATFDNARQQIADGQFKSFSLFDAAAQLKMKQAVVRLSVQNILNTKHYSWTVLDGINSFAYDYNLCGRTIMLTLSYTK